MDWLPTLETTFHIHSVLGWRNKLNKHGLRPHLRAWAFVPPEKRRDSIVWDPVYNLEKTRLLWEKLADVFVTFSPVTKSNSIKLQNLSCKPLVPGIHTILTASQPTPSTYPSVTYRAAPVVVGHQHRLLAVGALTQAARHRHTRLENICRCTKIYFVSESAE